MQLVSLACGKTQRAIDIFVGEVIQGKVELVGHIPCRLSSSLSEHLGLARAACARDASHVQLAAREVPQLDGTIAKVGLL